MKRVQTAVGDQLFSNISVWIESPLQGVNNTVILVDPDGVLCGKESRSCSMSVSEC